MPTPSISTGKSHGNMSRYNIGNVKLKVLAWGHCPFSKSILHDYTLTFNSSTIAAWPDGMKEKVSIHPNGEGVFLKPRYVPRSNFIAQSGSGNDNELSPSQSQSSAVPNTVEYRDHQTWYAVSSVLGTHPQPMNPTDEQETSNKELNRPKWNYFLERPANADSGEGSANGKNTNKEKDADKNSTPVTFDHILIPFQEQVSPPNQLGVHWKIDKKTPLFRGEDFWIEFIKRARSSNITSPGDATYEFKTANEQYKAIDVQNTDVKNVSLAANVVENFPRNQAIVEYEINEDGTLGGAVEDSREFFDFTNQVYCVVEIGMNDPEHNYFIIITEKANPIFVHVKAGVSFLLSRYKEVSGKELLQMDRFRMTVRNHLGRMAITFTGYEGSPWIIERKKVTGFEEDGALKTVQTPVWVAAAPISIWGGNRRSGFVFSPLQYEPKLSLPIPQKMTLNVEGDAKLSFLLTATDTETFLNNSTGKNADSLHANSMFTQDAQIAVEIQEEVRTEVWVDFFNIGHPLKQLHPDEAAKSNTNGASVTPDKSVHASRIEVRSKPRKLNTDTDTPDNGNLQGVGVFEFEITLDLVAGNHSFIAPSNSITTLNWDLPACKTPVMTHMRIFAKQPTQDAWEVPQIDLSNQVASYTDTWSSSDGWKIEHSGSVTFNLSPEGSPAIDVPGGDQTHQLLAMNGKQIYVKIYARYDPSCLNILTPPETPYTNTDTGQPIFTGMMGDGKLTIAGGKREIEFQLFDYSKVLKDMIFMNSPFYDGVQDVQAVRSILNIAGFNKTVTDNIYKQLQHTDGKFIGTDGRVIKWAFYGLPLSYDRLQQPFFKFQDGSNLWDALATIAERSGKLMFFGADGYFHFENRPDEPQFFSTTSFISPPVPVAYYTIYPPNFPEKQLALKRGDYTYESSSVYNDIHILSATPSYEIIIAGDIYYPSVQQPDAIGFLGYKKTMLQIEPIFGSLEAAKNAVRMYTRFYHPPIVSSFESYGRPIRALDVVDVDGQPLRLMQVTSEINAEENKWWQTFEGEWFFKGPDPSFGPEPALPPSPQPPPTP